MATTAEGTLRAPKTDELGGTGSRPPTETVGKTATPAQPQSNDAPLPVRPGPEKPNIAEGAGESAAPGEAGTSQTGPGREDEKCGKAEAATKETTVSNTHF
jgi:hypothetical protein